MDGVMNSATYLTLLLVRTDIHEVRARRFRTQEASSTYIGVDSTMCIVDDNTYLALHKANGYRLHFLAYGRTDHFSYVPGNVGV